ncbi:hypothetical protein COO60DRAFT_397494 [Scenedesmus sp. NREL 46B-D3]|nr:hypothetical protein COO60DRAFT_397494 [Scenedesmus sp. NREL 46B-D3]
MQGGFNPAAPSSPTAAATAAAASPAWLLSTSATRAGSAGIVYPQSPTAAAAVSSPNMFAGSGSPYTRNSMSATSPSVAHGNPAAAPAAVAAMHNIAAAAAAAATREMEDRLLLAEGRATAAERAALEAARAAELASRRINDVTCGLAHASAEAGDSRGRQDAALAMQQQLQHQVNALSMELHKLQVAAAETHATAAEGSWSGGQLRQQLVAMTEQIARLESERAADRAHLQALQATQQQQLAFLQAQQQQQAAALHQQHAAAVASLQQQAAAAAAAGAPSPRQCAAALPAWLGSWAAGRPAC